MIETKCPACGLAVQVSALDVEFESTEFIELCRHFDLKAPSRFEPSKLQSQQMAECPALNAAIAKAR